MTEDHEHEADEMWEPYLMLQFSYGLSDANDELIDYHEAETKVYAIFEKYQDKGFSHDGSGTGFGKRDHDGDCTKMTGADMIGLYTELKALDLPYTDLMICVNDPNIDDGM